jgi:lipid-A-disaccharide synthase
MKKIFILTGEPSGDKLASKVILKLQKNNPNIEYSCVGGIHLDSIGIKSIFDLRGNHIYWIYKCFVKYL